MNKDYTIEDIEQYLNDEMSPVEKQAFENELKVNESLRNELLFFKDMVKSIELDGEEQIRTQLKKTKEKLDQENYFQENTINKPNIIKMESNTNSKRSFSGLAIAASLLLLIAAGAFLYNRSDANGGNPYDEVYATYYQPENTQVKEVIGELKTYGMASTDKGRRDTLAAALAHYDIGEYNDAIKTLNDYLGAYPDNPTAKFYLGLTLLQMGEYAKASKHLQPITMDANSVFHDKAQWYLALAYTQFHTKEGLDFAKKLFGQITQNKQHEYYKSAKAILDQNLY